MDWRKDGAIWAPKGYDIEDLGGKASRLIEHQDVLQRYFSLPLSFAFPWQPFVGVFERNGLSEERSLEYGFKIDHSKLECLNDEEYHIVSSAIPHFHRPFFRSSSPDEDTQKTRMAGVYESDKAHASFAAYLQEGGIDEALRFQRSDWRSIPAEIVISYFNPLAVGLRKKHDIPQKGMGLLIQETVGGDARPNFSLVVQTNLEEIVRFQACDGFGEAIVSENKGYFGEYDRKTGKLVEPANLKYISDSKLRTIIENIISFERDIGMPSTMAGDYELSGYGDEVYILQCPEIPMLRDIGNITDSELLCRKSVDADCFFPYDAISGAAVRHFSHVVWVKNKKVDYDSKEGERLFELNQHLRNYLFIGGIEEYHAARLIYNAGGWIDTGTHDRFALDHQATLFRAENILYVNTILRREAYEHLLINPDFDTMRSVSIGGTLQVNELRRQASLTLD